MFSLQSMLLFTEAASLGSLAAGPDERAVKLAGRVLLHVALDVLLLLLLLLFDRVCRRGVVFLFLSSVMFRQDSLKDTSILQMQDILSVAAGEYRK